MILALEGIDGVGKTTTCKLLKEILLMRKVSRVEIIHDPNENDSLGSFVREKWKNNKEYKSSIWPLLFAASSINSQNYLSSKNNDQFLILDRSSLSTYAYFWDICDPEWIDVIHKEYVHPDLTILINLDTYSNLRRLINRGNEEAYKIEDIKRLKILYDKACSYFLKKNVQIEIVDISESATPREVVDKVYETIKKYL